MLLKFNCLMTNKNIPGDDSNHILVKKSHTSIDMSNIE